MTYSKEEPVKDIDEKTLDMVCTLSKIDLETSEHAAMLKSLEGILAYTHELDKINTENVEPCYHVLEGMEHPLRKDQVDAALERDTFLKNAPDQTGGMVRIPPVIGE